MKNRSGLTLLLFLMLLAAQAQDISGLKAKLSSLGFEQVTVIPDKIENDTLRFVIGVEHRGLNNAVDALKLASIVSSRFGFTKISIVVLKKGQTIFSHTDDGFQGVNEEVSRNLNREFSTNKYRFNLFYLPDLGIRFGYFDNPIQAKFNMLIASDVILARGLSLFTSLSIPISNDLDNQNAGLGIGPTYLEYFTQFLPQHFFMASAGLFFSNRYGLDIQYRYYPFERPLSVGFSVSNTGFYYLPKGALFFDPIQSLMVLADLEYTLSSQNLSISLQAGKFLDSRIGIAMEATKHYRNIELGLFAIANNQGYNGGFQLMLPLWPGRILRTRKLEFRGMESYRWAYSFSNEGQIGGKIKNPFSLTQGLRRFNYRLLNN